jgi:hypothetical protein
MHKGVQLVLLSRWSAASCNNFVAAAGGYAGGPLEIGFAPFFNEAHPFARAATVLSGLLSKGLALHVTVHLSFHRDDRTDVPTLQSRARKFDDFFSQFQGRVTMNLCPMLEDTWDLATYRKRLETVARELRWENPHPLLNFRRSNNVSPVGGPVSFPYRSGSFEEVIHLPGNGIHLQSEIHGSTAGCTRAGVYSNDGNYVWFDNPKGEKLPYREVAGSAGTASGPGANATYSLTAFLAGSARARTVLLWRPAYNLNQRRVDPTTKIVSYSVPGSPSSRTDSETDPAFDAVEIAALRAFLGIG